MCDAMTISNTIEEVNYRQFHCFLSDSLLRDFPLIFAFPKASRDCPANFLDFHSFKKAQRNRRGCFGCPVTIASIPQEMFIQIVLIVLEERRSSRHVVDESSSTLALLLDQVCCPKTLIRPRCGIRQSKPFSFPAFLPVRTSSLLKGKVRGRSVRGRRFSPPSCAHFFSLVFPSFSRYDVPVTSKR